MKKYRIEIEEIDDKDFEEIKDYFTSFTCNLWEDDEFLCNILLKGVNAWKGLYAVLDTLMNEINDEEEE